MKNNLRLGVNIDHVATIRNARGGIHPDPVHAAKLAETAGADGITAHLREDRRHISDDDLTHLMDKLEVPLNLEMAATEEMLEIALRHKPHAACLVPEKRELFGSMSVADNLVLGAYRRKRAGEKNFLDQMEVVYGLFPRLKERAKSRRCKTFA